MIRPRIIIIGTSGFALEALDLVERAGFDCVGFLGKEEKSIPADMPVLGHEDDIEGLKKEYNVNHAFIAVGDPELRAGIYDRLQGRIEFPAIIDDEAIVINSAIAEGCIIYPGAVVMSGCSLGAFSVINANASLGHECILERFVNINPGAAVAGRVSIGAQTTIGVGASIRENITIGASSMVGAGAVVVKNIHAHQVVAGNPARPLNHD